MFPLQADVCNSRLCGERVQVSTGAVAAEVTDSPNHRKSYHLPCGMESGSLQQFFGEFSSHCETHRPVQSPGMVKREARGVGECGVCLEELEERPGSAVLWTPCCGGWFHRLVEDDVGSNILSDLDFMQELCGEDGRDCWLPFLQMSSL